MVRGWLELGAAGVALMLCAATAGLAVRSVRLGDVISFDFGERSGYVKSVAGSLSLAWRYIPERPASPHPGGLRIYDDYLRVESREGWWRREWFTWRHEPMPRTGVAGAMYFEVIVPHWLVVLCSSALAMPLAARAWRAWQHRRRLARGCCPACGYDLRATPGRCPECGSDNQAAGAIRTEAAQS